MFTDATAIFTALSNFGAFGVLVGFLIWKDTRAESSRIKLEQERLAAKQLQDERKLAYDRERLEADKALAACLAGLTAAVQSRGK